MGVARQYLSEGRRREIALGLFQADQARSRGDELHGLCPIHGESNPSFSYNVVKDQFHCFSCGASGDLVKLWAEVNGLASDPKAAFQGFCKAFDIDIRKDRPSRPWEPQEGPSKESKPAEKTIPEKTWERLPALPVEWVRRLEKERGWTEAAMVGLDLRLYRHNRSGEERIAIPIRDETGSLVNVRLYLPKAAQNKVLSWGQGFGRSRLFPVSSYWPQDPVFLCEGEPDTIAAISRGLPAVTLTTGAGTWKREFEARFRGRDVVIAYDADQKGQDGAEKVARSLAGAAGLVRIIEWPDYMGRQDDGSWPADHGQDLTDFFVRHGRSVGDLKALLASARTVAAPTIPSDTDGPERFFVLGASGRGRSFKSNLLAREILDENELITDLETGLTYRWNGAFWDELPIRAIRRMALQKLSVEGTKARSEDAAAQVVDLALMDSGEGLNPRDHLICLKNGVLDLATMSLGPFRKDHYITFQFPVGFDPAARCPRWEQFMEETVQIPEVIGEVQEFFGYCLTKETRYEKALLLIGPGGDGKSTCLNVLQRLVGFENCSNVDLSTLDNEFHRASLFGKLLNVATEVEAQVFTSAYFKALVSGDRIRAAYKHKDSFEFTPFCKMAFSSNRFPKVQDNSHAFFRRLLPVRFRWQVEPAFRDPHLGEALAGELDGIFLWAIKGLDRLRARGAFELCEASRDVLAEYQEANNPVIGFLDECTTDEPAGFIPASAGKAELYTEYADYCKRYGFHALNAVHFARELREQRPGIKDFRPSAGGPGRRERRWEGIRLVGKY